MANWASIDNLGNPADPGWQEQNLVEVAAPNGAKWRVHKAAAPAFSGLLGDLVANGYVPQSSGGFNYRNIRGSNRLSQHAFGTAIDINAESNPLGSSQTDMPANIGDLAAKHGLEWGGNWKGRKDPMHFEWRGDGSVQAVEGPPMPGAPRPEGVPARARIPGVAAPVQLGDVLAPAPVAEPAAPKFGDFLVAAAQQERARVESEAARKRALFGGGAAGLFG